MDQNKKIKKTRFSAMDAVLVQREIKWLVDGALHGQPWS